MMERRTSGFAVVLVLWTLVLLSTIALTLASTVGTETKAAQDLWNDLQAERLAISGHQFEEYLETRGLGVSTEDLTGLPVDPLVPGYRYRVRLDSGTIDFLLEGENGKIDLVSADEETLIRFFTAWTGDAARGRRISDSILDWTDPDDSPRPLGAEAAAYAGNGYLPRNASLGAADLFLIKGLMPTDFFPSTIESDGGAVILRNGLSGVTTTVPVGRGVNPNYASTVVLQSVPGMTSHLLETILALRTTSTFKNQEDFRQRTGVATDASVLNRLVFDRGTAPATLSIATLAHSSRVRAYRRTQALIRPRGWRPGMRLLPILWAVDRHTIQ
jgi:type II secretory pathway component PulK